MAIEQLKGASLKFYGLLLNFKEKNEETQEKNIENKQLFADLERQIDVKLDEILEMKAKICKNKLQISFFPIENTNIFLQDKKIKSNPLQETQEKKNQFFENFSDLEEIKELQRKLHLNQFLLIEGPASSGKTALLKHILKTQDKILVYLDANTDLKSLIGAYVSGDKIGEFIFRNGPLTQAITEGKVLILENFQEANEEIMIMLIKIVENKGLDLSNQQDFLRSKPGFQIIAVANFEMTHSPNKRNLLLNHVDSFLKQNKGFDYTLDIGEHFYPKICCKGVISNIIIKTQQVLSQKLPEILKKQPRSLQMRKWLDLFKRLDFYLGKFYGSEGILNNNLTEDFRRIILLETTDVFLSNDPEILKDTEILEEMLQTLQLESLIPQLGSFFLQYTPQIELSEKNVLIGRLGLIPRDFFNQNSQSNNLNEGSSSFTVDFSNSNRNNIKKIVYNSYSSRLLEKIAICVVLDEPCLLVGDTGCGKTTMVQHCAEIFRKKLWVYNMNPNSDAIDLIGGFKPLDVKVLLKQLLSKYLRRFDEVGNTKANEKFLDNLRGLLINKNYVLLMQCLLESLNPIKIKIQKKFQSNPSKMNETLRKWDKLQKQLENFLNNRDKIDSNLAFHYVEGSLISALKNGDWILIDEINLANNEVLQRVLPILEGESLLLYDKGDLKTIKRHKDFRLLACMNPGKDIGKKELPENIRAKFTEFFIEDIEQKQDLLIFIERQIGYLYKSEICEKLVEIFMEFKQDIQNHLLDSGNNRRLHVSLRNLARTLKYIINNHDIYGMERTLYDALYLGFASSLSKPAQEIFQRNLSLKFGISSLQYENMLKKTVLVPNTKEYVIQSGVIL